MEMPRLLQDQVTLGPNQESRASPPAQIADPILNDPDQILRVSDKNQTVDQQDQQQLQSPDAAPKLQADDAKPVLLGIESPSIPPKSLLLSSPNRREKRKRCSEVHPSPSESCHLKSPENRNEEFSSGLGPRMLVSGPQLSTKLRKPNPKNRAKSK